MKGDSHISSGYIKLRHSNATRELLKDLNAFIVLTVIALRAKRTNDFSIHGLRIGQALIGDYESYGLSRQQYRSAKDRLKRYGLAGFRATNEGTIATLLNSLIYDINDTASQRTDDGQATGTQPTVHR